MIFNKFFMRVLALFGSIANGFISSSYSWVLIGIFAAVMPQCGFLGV